MDKRTITKAAAIPAAVLETFDNLTWENVSIETLAGFVVQGVENGCGSITLYGTYPVLGIGYVFNIFSDEENAYMQFQRAQIPYKQ